MGEKKFLGARLRTADFGSAGSRRLLRNGEIPGVVYGKDQPIHVIVNAREFAAKRSGFGESTLISLNVADEKSHDVFVKSYQEDLLKGVVQHIDFFEVTAGQAVRTNVRIELVGNPVGTRNGGVLEQLIHEVEVECLPSDLPETISGDISALDVNESFRVNQLAIPEGIRIFIDQEETVASIKYVKEEAPAASDETADAAADAAPASDAAAK